MTQSGTEQREGAPITLIALAGLAAIGGLLIGLPGLNSGDGHPHHISKCMSNIKQIGLALHFYASDNDGSFPASLRDLLPDYISDEKILSCPELALDMGGVGYEYEYTAGLTSAAPAELLLAFEEPGHHRRRRDGLNALRVDGAVEWIGEETFGERLVLTQAYLASQDD